MFTIWFTLTGEARRHYGELHTVSLNLISIYSCNHCRTCLWRCLKKDFKAVNISVATISCERSILVIVTMAWKLTHTKTSQNIGLQSCYCDPSINLYGDQAQRSSSSVKKIKCRCHGQLKSHDNLQDQEGSLLQSTWLTLKTIAVYRGVALTDKW